MVRSKSLIGSFKTAYFQLSCEIQQSTRVDLSFYPFASTTFSTTEGIMVGQLMFPFRLRQIFVNVFENDLLAGGTIEVGLRSAGVKIGTVSIPTDAGAGTHSSGIIDVPVPANTNICFFCDTTGLTSAGSGFRAINVMASCQS